MREEIIFAGFGGQGVLLMGKIFAHAAMESGKEVTWMPCYGAEVRGGTAHSMVVVSDHYIPSPIVTNPTTCIAMNEPSAVKFIKKIKTNGLLILNKSLVKRMPRRKDIKILSLPLSDIAAELGNAKVTNMVALGAYIQVKKTVPIKTVLDCLKKAIPAHRRNLLDVNTKALYRGAQLARDTQY